MFSGGLDSLAGAVDTAVGGANLVLVSHRPVSTLDSRQKKLFAELQRRFPDQARILCPDLDTLHSRRHTVVGSQPWRQIADAGRRWNVFPDTF